MSANVAQISLAALKTAPRPISNSVVIGKDVLDLLAGSMYLNPLNIFREYIQNAADSIDQARDASLFVDTLPVVSISFDRAERTIRIRDNGIGIPGNEFNRRLTTVGSSQKRGTTQRGFRGVGRLSALGYCQELVFRGRAPGDSKVSELRWDGRALRENIRDKSFQGGLSELIESAVTETKLPSAEYPERFFEVEIRKVARLRNDILLNEELIRDYLSQVAPVPFSADFSYGPQVQDYLEKHGVREPINIMIDDGKGPVVHRMRDHFPVGEDVFDKVRGVEFVEYEGTDGEVAAIGWICDHSYSGSLPKKQGLGGIRLRAGNIQVGDGTILSEFFPEARFAGWVIGEIHILSSKILPNGRRDEFEPSVHYSQLQGQFTLEAKKLTQCIRERSQKRNRLRSVHHQLSTVQKWADLAAEKQLSRLLVNVIQEVAAEKLQQTGREIAKFRHEPDHHNLVSAKLAEMEVMLGEMSTRTTVSPTQRDLASALEKPMSVAIKTILKSAREPREGLDLSIQVLDAIHQSISV
jgi:molecular chaperone HtpG